MNINNLLISRRTINAFKPGKPPEELICQAIDVARWAPNHHLTEPWRFYLLGDETKLAIVELNTSIVEASKGSEIAEKKRKKWSEIPGWLVVTVRNANDPLQAQEDYAACCCAIHNFSLSLWGAGIGVKWTTGEVTRDPALYDLIWVDPKQETVVGMLWYGYPQEIPEATRKPVSEIIVRLP